MRIALITPEFVTEKKFDGGLANFTLRTALCLKAQGHDPHVIVSSTTQESTVYRDIPVHRACVWKRGLWTHQSPILEQLHRCTRNKYQMTGKLLLQSFILYRTLRRVHAQHPFDVAHYAQLGGVGFFRLPSVPSVVRLSSDAKLWHECGGFGETSADIKQLASIEHRALKRADAIFGPSKFIAEHVSKDIGRPIDVIESPFTMDTDHLDDSVYTEHLQNKKYLLFYGSIGHIKGVGTIAKIIHTLLSQHRDLQFVFVGKQLNGQKGGPLLEQVRTNAKEHSDRIMHFHPLRHNQLYPIVQHAHTVVLPSLIDNFPNTCIESMAHNRVVIGTRGNGFEQLIDHGKSGLLCAVDDPEDLLQNINMALLMTEKEREAMGAHAAARIETLHPDIIGPKLLALYEKAIAAHHSPAIAV